MAVASNENLRIILTAVDNASRVFNTVNKSVANTQTKLNNATKWAKKFTKTIGLVGSIVWGLAVNEFMGFEKQMSKVKAITGANSEEFKKMTALAKKMWATTAFTGKEAGDALEFLGMAWLSVQESMDALPGALELASAGNLSLWESADIATNIMAQFGIEAKNIGRVNDVLAKSATSANTSVQEMADAMKYMGPVANSLKVPLEETASAINVLANNGIKWGMAGQSFSASLLRITKPTDAMQASMDKLNLSLFDSKGQFVWLTKTVKQLEIGTKNMTDKEKAKHIATVFGIQSTKQWLTLLKEGSGTMEDYTKSLENAEGSAKKMAKTQLDNLAGSFTLLKSAISGAMIEIGGSISTYLRPAMDWLTTKISNWRTEWEGLSPGMKTTIKNIGLLVAGITALVVVIGTISILLTPIIAGFWLLSTTLGIVTTAVTVLGKAMLFLTANPIGMLITAIGALVYVGYQFYKNWDDITLGAKYAWKLFSTAVGGSIDWLIKKIGGFLTDVGNWFSEKWNSIKDMFNTVLWVIKTIITAYFNWYVTIIKFVIDAITLAWSEGLNFLKTLISWILEGIGIVWQDAMDLINWIVTTGWTAITWFLTWTMDGLTTKFKGWFSYIEGLYNKVKKWLSYIGIGSSEATKKANDLASQASKTSGARAIGGPVSKGNTYLVWENGPELFTPGTTGRISPNSSLWWGAPAININLWGVTVNNEADENRLVEKIKEELATTLQMYKYWIS